MSNRYKHIFFETFILTFLFSIAIKDMHGQTVSLHDSLRILLKTFQKNTTDENLKEAIQQARAIYKSDYIDKHISGKLVKVQELLVSTSSQDSGTLSYNLALTNLLRYLDPKGAHSDFALSLEYLAQLYHGKTEYQKALNLYQEALDIKKKSLGDNHPDYVFSLNRLAGLYYVLEQYDKSLALREEEVILKKKSVGENNIEYAVALVHLIWSLYRMGQYDKAVPLCVQTFSILKKTSGKKTPEYVNIISYLARLNHLMGQYDKAQPLYEEALEITKTTHGENHFEYAVRCGNLAFFFDKIMGQYDKAQPLYQQALAIIAKTSGDQHTSYLTNLNNLANLFHTMEKYNDALPLYEKLLEITKKIYGELHPAYVSRLCDLGSTYFKMGQSNKALLVSEQALSIINNPSVEKHPKFVGSLGSLAILYYRMGIYDTALSLMLKHSAVIKRISGKEHPEFASSLSYVGMLYNILGDETESASLLIKAAGINLNHLSQTYSTLSEQEKIAFLKKESFQFDFLPSILWTTRKNLPALAKQAYENELALKGMVLEDQRNVLRSIRGTGDSGTLQLYEKWRINKLFLGNQQLSPIASRIPYFDSLLYVTTQMEQELSRRTLFFRNLQQRQRTTASDISKNLREGEASIEFIRFCFFNKRWTDSVLYAAMIILPQDSVPQFVPLFEENQLITLLKPAEDYAGDEIVIENLYGDGQGIGRSSDSLYQLVWKPLEKYLKDVHTVYYAPTGLLHRLAFHAIRTDDNQFLIQKYQLNQVLSTRSLLAPVEVTSKPLSAGVWGNIQYSIADGMKTNPLKTGGENIDVTRSSFSFYNSDTRGSRGGGWEPLPSSRREIDSIVKLFQNANIGSFALSEALATEEAFKMLDAKSPQVLHFATHGFFLPVAKGTAKADDGLKSDNAFMVHENPMFRSGLILAGGNHVWEGKAAFPGKEDGILTAYEIAHIDLSKTHLVVLSACETALGELQRNEGVIGLQRAFKLAGVKQILVSLWSVYDEPTMELMTLFYRNWLSGLSTREALRNAQLTMKIKYPEPYYWAAFVLVD